MKRKGIIAKGLAGVLAISMLLTGCGGKSGKDNKDMKDLVYKSEKLSCTDDMKGDISSFTVAGDKIYVYTTETEWDPDPGNTEDAEAEEEAFEAKDQEETADGDAAVATTEDAVVDGDEQSDSTDGTNAISEEGEEKPVDDAEAADDTEATDGADAEIGDTTDATDDVPDDYYGTTNQYFYTCKADGSDLQEIQMDVEKNDNNWLNYFAATEDGMLYMLYSGYDEKSEQSTYLIKILDAGGSQTGEVNLNGILDENDYVQAMRLDKDGNIYLMGDQSVYVLDKDGNKIAQIKADTANNSWLMAMARTSDGQIVVAMKGQDGMKVQTVDLAKKAMGESYDIAVSGYGTSNSALIDGADYSFYYNDGSSLYGYDMQSKQSKEILNWISSNINTSYVGDTRALKGGQFITNYSDYSSEDGADNGLYIFTKVDPSEVADKVTITYAGLYVDDAIKSAAVKFNKSQDKYQIMVKDYSTYDDAPTQMNNDLLAGEIPDIIDLSGISAEKYISKGMLLDLYTLMDKDSDIKKDDFIENVLQVMETDGKLYHISPTFGVNVLIGKTSDIGGRDKFTVQDLIDLEQSKGNDAKAFYMRSNTSVLNMICTANYEDYIDWNTGKCSFNSDEFVKLLEYANTYPKDEDINWDEDYESLPTQIRSGKVILADIYSLGMEEIELYNAMFEDDISFIGYPSDKSAGASASMNMDLGIYAKSKNVDGAWAFLKTFLTKDYICKGANNYYSGFPLRKDALEYQIKRYSATEKYTDEYGNEIEPYQSSWGYDDLDVEIGPLSEDQVNKLREVIASVDHLYVYNDDVMTIISDETGAYFSGQKSAKEVADIVQNRVSNYVNENR
ncbi:MAG: hypothetical protein MRZ88_00590 [Firmicutes bacterium]|nr:hypothetical protein [Bacillota bacterium]